MAQEHKDTGLESLEPTAIDTDRTGALTAEELAAESETGARAPVWLWQAVMIALLCVFWSLFQLLHAIDEYGDKIARYIHLTFAFSLVFLVYPFLKKRDKPRRALIRDNILLGILLLVMGAMLVLDVTRIVDGSVSMCGRLAELKENDPFLVLFFGDATPFICTVIPPIIWLLTIALLVEGVRRIGSAVLLMGGGDAAKEPAGFMDRFFDPHHPAQARKYIPAHDLILTVAAMFVTLILVWDAPKVVEAGGLINADNPQFFVYGIMLILMLLEATRRSLGVPLMALCLLFLLFALYPAMSQGTAFGIGWLDDFVSSVLPAIPGEINPVRQPLQSLVGQVYLTDGSIFGTPIGVSVTFVFIFVLFGALLDKAGAGKYFIDVAFSGLGSQTAGPAKAAIVASGATGLVSGSSIANTVTTGTFTIPLMKEVGLPAYKAGAVEVAASTNGQLMPPIMGAAAFIMAQNLNIPYLDVITAAFIPAVISYLALFFVVHMEAMKLGIRRIPKSELPPFWATFVRGLHFLVPLVLLIWLMIVEQYSPIFSVVAALAALAVIMLVQRPVIAFAALATARKQGLAYDGGSPGGFIAGSFVAGIFDMWHGLVAGARNMVAIAIAVAAAGIIVGVVETTGLGGRLLDIVESLSFGILPIALVLTAIAAMVLGMGLPTTANYIIVSSLLATVIQGIAADSNIILPLIACHMFVFYFGILADDTPPVGLAAYAAAAIAKSDPIKTGIQGFTYDLRTAILPFVFVFNTELLLIEDVVKTGQQGTTILVKYAWIGDWFMIVYIFLISLFAMLAFASFLQGYLVRRLNWPERLLALACASLMFVPNLYTEYLGLEAMLGEFSRRILQIGGLGIMIAMYLLQRVQMKGEAQPA